MSRRGRPPDAVAQAASGDPAGLTRLFREHGELVHRTAFRLTGSADDADDVVQDVFIGLPEALRHYDERGSFAAWLVRVTVRAALTRLRRARRRREEPLPGDGAPDASPASDEAVAARLTVAQALAALPEPLRLVFVLKEVEGYSHAEVAELLGIRRNTSEVRLVRALRRLRHMLRDSR